MSRRSTDGQAGFALVESIAVLALSGLVLLTLVIATDLVSRNSAAAARSANGIETLAMGFRAVRRDVENFRFIRAGEKTEDPILFSGSSQAVALAVADDAIRTTAGESLVLIESRYENGRGFLIRSSAPAQPGVMGFGAAKFTNPAVLLSGPWRYQFSYYDPQGETDRWRSDWQLMGRLPAGVRLDVLNAAGQKVVSSLVVRLPIDSGGCADSALIDCVAANAAVSTDENQNPDQNTNQDGNNPDQNPGQNPDQNNPGSGNDANRT